MHYLEQQLEGSLDKARIRRASQNRIAIGIADGEFLGYLDACARLRTQRVKVEFLVELSPYENLVGHKPLIIRCPRSSTDRTVDRAGCVSARSFEAIQLRPNVRI
jgi:hypothetical protein